MKIDKKKIVIILSLMVIGGIYGFIYETIFYRIDLGYFVKRGSTFGPWIPIYAFGSVLIYLTTSKYRKSPLKVFLISAVGSGLLEYLTGFLLLKICGIRLWNYNTEIWNFLNVNGFICLRSVLFFSISGLILIYLIVPCIEKIYYKKPDSLTKISYILCSIFMIDFIINIFL